MNGGYNKTWNREVRLCPWCGSSNYDCEWVDVGVGCVPCSPMNCDDCGAHEFDWRYLDEVEEHATAEEKERGAWGPRKDEVQVVEENMNETTTGETVTREQFDAVVNPLTAQLRLLESRVHGQEQEIKTLKHHVERMRVMGGDLL